MGDETGQAARAPYAADPARARRLVAEPPSATRTDFQRDRDRIVHSTAFRRLAHKTQVFVDHESDHFRTRLTHTIEVAQIARALARALRLDNDLAEAVALGHDLGHTPFGHTGEDALNACMAEHGGFDHNSHALRIVTELERHYAEFDGLNLSQPTLAGLIKHNGPLLDAWGAPTERYRTRGVPAAILCYDAMQSLDLSLYASLEAQAAAIADDIAYDAHDIDDGLRAGLFQLDEIAAVPLPGKITNAIRAAYPGLDNDHLVHELVRELIGLLIDDVVAETSRRLAALKPQSADDVRSAASPVAGFSAAMAEGDGAIKAFLETQMYRHRRVMQVMDQAAGVIRDLYARYTEKPADLPVEWQEGLSRLDEAARARRVADFIAGMTDRYALAEHGRLFDSTPELR